MMRGLHPKVNFKTIAESRFWNTSRQKDTFAKLVYELGQYDEAYWLVDRNSGERAFVEHFSNIYG